MQLDAVGCGSLVANKNQNERIARKECGAMTEWYQDEKRSLSFFFASRGDGPYYIRRREDLVLVFWLAWHTNTIIMVVLDDDR
jgi:hypothetical protein